MTWWIAVAHALTLDGAVVGDELQLTVTGATPGASLRVIASAAGLGSGPCPAALGGLCLDVARADRLVPMTADALGDASAILPLPAGLDTLWFQAADPAAPALSGVVELSLVPEVVDLSCTPWGGNVLRFDCTITLDRAAPAELIVVDGAGEEVFDWAASSEALVHDVVVYGMWADDAFTVLARAGGPAAELGLVTDPLPAAADLDLLIAGATDAGPFLFNMGCAGTDVLVVADGEGRVRWYQDVADLSPGAEVSRGVSLTPQGTLLVLVDRYEVAEVGFDGTEYWSTSVTDPLHHEVLWWNDQVAAIDARTVPFPNGVTYVMDGVQWFDGLDGAPLVHFAHEDVVDPQVVLGGGGYWTSLFPGAVDWAHVNALGMADDGTGVMSLKGIDALHKLVLDPDDPAFGTLLWTLTGKASSPLITDLARVSSTGVTPLTFGDQHHVTMLGPDELLFFDNQPGPSQPSRVLRVVVDEVAGTADLVESWPVNRSCPGQGSAVRLANGNVIADCARLDTLVEVEAGTGSELWSMEASCANGASPPRPLYRALVVEDW